MAFFPRTDASQFVINLKAQSGTRLEVTEEQVRKSRRTHPGDVAPEDLDVILSNIGVTADSPDLHPATRPSIRPSCKSNLNEGHRTGSYEYMDRLRERLRLDMPQLTGYFQSGGMADAVLNLGLPAPESTSR